MVWILFGLLVILTVLICMALYFSQGRLAPVRDNKGSIVSSGISEITYLEIGKMRQGMILQGENERNSVLLFLHGGPGTPEYFIYASSGLKLEKDFTVCWWEQRGSGLSYHPDIPPGTMNLEQMVQDTVELTNYLRNRFGQEKIYLAGHSWGSFLGMNVIKQFPELYHAYIGVGQVTDQLESERLAYAYMFEEARRLGDTKMEKSLLNFDMASADSLTIDYLLNARTNGLNRLGSGMFHDYDTPRNMVLPFLTLKAYTLTQKRNYLKGSLFSLKHLFNITTGCSLFTEIPKVEIPVYFIHGLHDKQVSYKLLKEYYEVLEAPVKRLYTFEKSAHCPIYEEPELFTSILHKDILS